MHALPPNGDQVRPLGPAGPARLAHRAVAVTLALAGLVALSFSPLIALECFGAAIGVVLDRRGAFGVGRFRLMLGFIAAPWLGLAGIALALLGSTADGLAFLLLPGLTLVLGSLLLLGVSFIALWRSRPRRPR